MHPAASVFAVVVIGWRQHALFALGHEGVHWLITRQRGLNDFLTHIFFALPFGSSLKSLRAFHLGHHDHTGGPGDPELTQIARAAQEFALPASRVSVTRRFLLDFLGLGARFPLGLARVMGPQDRGDLLLLLAFWGPLLVLLALSHKLWFVPLWFTALITVHWALFRLRMWTEHLGADGTHRVRASGWQRVLFLPYHMEYHYEHHLAGPTCPAIDWPP